MRGTLHWPHRYFHGTGIIPAHAGNTLFFLFLGVSFWDHPRACGEHGRNVLSYSVELGSSPRMRGTLRKIEPKFAIDGIIPAHAGNTSSPQAGTYRRRDHPRACGEHCMGVTVSRPQAGSSPRMRGTRPIGKIADIDTGIIPAHAGNTAGTRNLLSWRWDHPRACGEHFIIAFHHRRTQGSSPRMRGTLPFVGVEQHQAGIIPAHAGNTCARHR